MDRLLTFVINCLLPSSLAVYGLVLTAFTTPLSFPHSGMIFSIVFLFVVPAVVFLFFFGSLLYRRSMTRLLMIWLEHHADYNNRHLSNSWAVSYTHLRAHET